MSAKTFPSRVKFFIADDVRQDSEKPMLIGFFPDDKVVVHIPADPSREAPVIIGSLAILAAFIDCKGSFEAEFSLYLPSGTALVEHQKIDGGIKSVPSFLGKSNIYFNMKFVPFGVPELGEYKFVVQLDKKKYEYNFNIDRPHQ